MLQFVLVFSAVINSQGYNHYPRGNEVSLFIDRLKFITVSVFVFSQLATLYGCVLDPAPYLSNDWTEHSVEIKAPVDGANARLQVFITYSGLASSHTALRLVDSNGQVIFWDPAGDYGRFDDDWQAQYGAMPQTTERARDLIVTNPPDVSTFVRWRWTLDDTRVEVFEWDLAVSQATRFRNALLNGTDEEHPTGNFSTWTYPMFCTMATSDFLRRFASPIIRLPKRYFFPHNLAQALYTQSPSHVRVFTWDGKKTVYSPPGPTSVQR